MFIMVENNLENKHQREKLNTEDFQRTMERRLSNFNHRYAYRINLGIRASLRMKRFKPKKFIGDFKEHLTPLKEITKYQAAAVKGEVQDLKKIFESKDLVFFKTDAVAVVLRKLGGLDEFLATVDKLTKEGYLLVAWEDVSGLPLPGGSGMLGTFYIFQRSKYI